MQSCVEKPTVFGKASWSLDSNWLYIPIEGTGADLQIGPLSEQSFTSNVNWGHMAGRFTAKDLLAVFPGIQTVTWEQGYHGSFPAVEIRGASGKLQVRILGVANPRSRCRNTNLEQCADHLRAVVLKLKNELSAVSA